MVNVVGLGYIGLPTALMLSSHGVKVVGTDIDKNIVDNLKNRKVTFKEDGLEDLLKSAIDSGIEFSNRLIETNMYIVSVPTPYDESTKKIDSGYLEVAVKNVLDVCSDNAIIIIESTISPGTIDKIIRPIVDRYKKNIDLVHAPERILPGNMLYELENNSRTIGVDSHEVGEFVSTLYKSFCKGEIIITDIKTAEMSKVVENTFRDINIAFANELAKICRSDNMDVYEIIKIANKHPRVNILNPGPGVGGHCISVDPWFLVGDYPDLAKIIHMAREINDSMPRFVLDRLKEVYFNTFGDEARNTENKQIDFKRVGIYGLTYKPDIDDIRESPTLQFLDLLTEDERDRIRVYDPMVSKLIVKNQYTDFNKFINDIDVLVIMVDHSELKSLENLLTSKIILDTKNVIKTVPTYKL